MQKNVSFKVKGMQRDLSASAFNSEYAYENKNIRIMPTDKETLFSIINEKGTRKINIESIKNIVGIPIGYSTINNEFVIFTAGDKNNINADIEFKDEETINDINSKEISIDIDTCFEDRIYKFEFKDDVFVGEILFRGDLNFNYKYPIETLPIYENSDIKKIYWTDGLNQPRMINIENCDKYKNKWNKDSFNFVTSLNLNEKVTITKNNIGSGKFLSGIIQYSFTYFNQYGQESNIFYTSPLYYISYDNRGGSPENVISNSFTINIENVDTKFDYVRIYSIHRTSENATPSVKRVIDISINRENPTITYTDTGLYGDTIDPYELLYVGGEIISAKTLSQKDNTLFLGNIENKRFILDSTIRNYFYGNNKITFKRNTRYINFPEPISYYPYINQLSLNSRQIKTFKYLEYYRFGIQAQHYTGKWSEPIWINDVRNMLYIDTVFHKSDSVSLPVAEFTIDNIDIINKLLTQGYIRVRPVIVYPTVEDREVLCQGILCPTVYNVSDRYSNSPFVQSSWFVRPNAPFDEYKAFHYTKGSDGTWGGDWSPLDNASLEPTIYSRAGIMQNNATEIKLGTTSTTSYIKDSINKGAWAEFRHNYPIPSNNKRNAEIQCIWNPPENPYVDDNATDTDLLNWVNNNSENFYIDQSILTFHSPDIEFDDSIKNIDTSNLKLRIVGVVPLTSFISDIDIQTSTVVNNFKNSEELPIGFYKEPIGAENGFYEYNKSYGDSHFGWRSLISGAFWFDELNAKDSYRNDQKLTTGFVVYPWHRNGSLNNTKFSKDGYRSAMLDKKRISNLRYSYKTQYIDYGYIWNAYVNGNNNNTGISGVSIFNSNEVSLIRLPSPENSKLPDINYYGNVDKLITVSRIGDKKDGYPIMTSGCQNAEANSHGIFTSNYMQVDETFTEQITGTDPVRIKYKSTPHAVLALNYTKDGKQRVLPTIQDFDRTFTTITDLWNINYIGGNLPTEKHAFWDKNKVTDAVSQDVIYHTNIGIYGDVYNKGGLQYGWLWLGELYNDNVQNRFGGKTEEAFENNLWLPCGESVSLIDYVNGIKDSVTIRWEEGDTYYQRYDHIKTYPFTLEDQNQITDIISFMCETRVNLDGRYDRNRGQTSNFAITSANFNLLNKVYNQQDNFFNYRTINPNKLNINVFNNLITWTKTKTFGELIDSWTNITLASTLDLDGDKGDVRALRRFNNNIIAFQDRGISQILYNENMQISSTEGVPIEIANSGKVNGKRYITNNIGCTNKWSICETPNGIYFIDDITKGIFLFNGELNNVSDRFGFHSWINANLKDIDVWNPIDFNNFITYYDKVNGDVYFVNKNECLAYSERLGQFTSFYNYENTQGFIAFQDKGLWIKDNKLWLHNDGDYNMFFGTYKPFYITLIANPDMQLDKIFNNIEFRADSWDKNNVLLNTTFDTLNTWNEYQNGTINLINNIGKPSSLKRKFRIWRTNIPRDNNRNRMRNPWLYIKLSMEKENINRTILHDVIVNYFE